MTIPGALRLRMVGTAPVCRGLFRVRSLSDDRHGSGRRDCEGKTAQLRVGVTADVRLSLARPRSESFREALRAAGGFSACGQVLGQRGDQVEGGPYARLVTGHGDH
jgi:hypothetical protein